MEAPAIGGLEPLEVLSVDYAANPDFLPKIADLRQRFFQIRRTRPDGSCFYRSYIFGILEQLVGNLRRAEVFREAAEASLNFCLSAGYERVAIEDFHEKFLSCVDRASREGASVGDVAAMMAECDGYLVCWVRMLTSSYLKAHADEYSVFLTSHSSMAQFCSQEVDPMTTEADHLQIAALSSYLKVPVCVVYLDRSEGSTASEHLFQEAASGPFDLVRLLYRPGHYDLIYPLV